MHTNELTFNELSITDFLPNDWGHIDITNNTIDDEICFKLIVWSLQCKYSSLLMSHVNNLQYGISNVCDLITLKKFKWGLEILNNYNPRDIENNTTIYNNISYSKILNILQILQKY